MLDCRQVLAELSNYVDDEVSRELRQAIEEHLERCGRCWVVFDTTKKTLTIVSEQMPSATPQAVSDRLIARLRESYATSR